MALVGVELETLVSEPDALTTRPPLPYDSEKKTFHYVFRIILVEYPLRNIFHLWYLAKYQIKQLKNILLRLYT